MNAASSYCRRQFSTCGLDLRGTPVIRGKTVSLRKGVTCGSTLRLIISYPSLFRFSGSGAASAPALAPALGPVAAVAVATTPDEAVAAAGTSAAADAAGAPLVAAVAPAVAPVAAPDAALAPAPEPLPSPGTNSLHDHSNQAVLPAPKPLPAQGISSQHVVHHQPHHRVVPLLLTRSSYLAALPEPLPAPGATCQHVLHDRWNHAEPSALEGWNHATFHYCNHAVPPGFD